MDSRTESVRFETRMYTSRAECGENRTTTQLHASEQAEISEAGETNRTSSKHVERTNIGAQRTRPPRGLSRAAEAGRGEINDGQTRDLPDFEALTGWTGWYGS